MIGKTLSPEEQLELRKKQHQETVEKYMRIAQQQAGTIDRSQQCSQGWGMTYKKTGAEARAEIRG